MIPLPLPAVGRLLADLVSRLPGLLALLLFVQFSSAAPSNSVVFRSNDVVAFIGGEDIAAQKDGGHLETLLTISFHALTFRNLGWEGDTVFAQPREIGFPDLFASLKSSGATVIVSQFGRTEALSGGDPTEFGRSYGRLLTACKKIAPRIVMVAPPPFENGGNLLPQLSAKNLKLASYVDVIRNLAREHQCAFVDLFSELGGVKHGAGTLTENGLQLTARGQGLAALAFARQLGFSELVRRVGEPSRYGPWSDPRLEQLRQFVIAKDTLWFHYYRPQNWAFLGGDRVSQPSSRDHLDPKVRWFPSEMEKFLPLIQAKEQEIEKLATTLR